MKIHVWMGHMLSYALVVTFYLIYIKAYINGYTLTVTINSIGEAGFELVLLTFILVFGFYCLYKEMRSVMQKQ